MTAVLWTNCNYRLQIIFSIILFWQFHVFQNIAMIQLICWEIISNKMWHRFKWSIEIVVFFNRHKSWSSDSWSHWSQKTTVWHMGQHSKCGQQDGEYRGAGKDPGTRNATECLIEMATWTTAFIHSSEERAKFFCGGLHLGVQWAPSNFLLSELKHLKHLSSAVIMND